MPTLILTPRFTEDAQVLWRAAGQLGWNVERLTSWRAPDELATVREPVLYLEALFGPTLAAQFGLRLLEPAIDWLPRLPEEFRSRKVVLSTLHEARYLLEPAFVKPPNDKSFPARVYAGSELPGRLRRGFSRLGRRSRRVGEGVPVLRPGPRAADPVDLFEARGVAARPEFCCNGCGNGGRRGVCEASLGRQSRRFSAGCRARCGRNSGSGLGGRRAKCCVGIGRLRLRPAQSPGGPPTRRGRSLKWQTPRTGTAGSTEGVDSEFVGDSPASGTPVAEESGVHLPQNG